MPTKTPNDQGDGNPLADIVCPSLTVVILTFNEALHIERCIGSVQDLAAKIVVVDSGSTDETREIAARLGARILRHAWLNQATQLNRALEHGDIHTTWVMRLDADEVVDPTLNAALRHVLFASEAGISGFEVRRYMVYQGKMIRHGGGVSPGRVLRVWRNGCAVCENRWMDEHMLLLRGRSQLLAGAIVDHNLNSLTWWVQKHNMYASREAVDLLDVQFGFLRCRSESVRLQMTARIKRQLKNNVYMRLPGGGRAFLYFLYRIIVRLGFLDGPRGMAFHFMQGFWYRALVDLKVSEVRRHMRQMGCDVLTAIDRVLDIQLEVDADKTNQVNTAGDK